MDNKDQLEGNAATLTEPTPLTKTSASGNLQGPPGKPTAVGASEDPNRPLTGYDRKRAVREAQRLLGFSPQARIKK